MMKELKELQDLVMRAAENGDLDQKTHLAMNLQLLELGYSAKMLELVKQQNLLMERQAEAMQQIANSLDHRGQNDRKL